MREHTQLHYDFCAPLAPQLHYDFDSKGKGKSQGKFLIKTYFTLIARHMWRHGAMVPRRHGARSAAARSGRLRRRLAVCVADKNPCFFSSKTRCLSSSAR